jgi:hypothetical protein
MRQLKNLLIRLIDLIKHFNPIKRIKLELKYRKRLKELKKRDPFIYR